MILFKKLSSGLIEFIENHCKRTPIEKCEDCNSEKGGYIIEEVYGFGFNGKVLLLKYELNDGGSVFEECYKSETVGNNVIVYCRLVDVNGLPVVN